MPTPESLRVGHDAVAALAALFNCVDPVRWSSLARPAPGQMAALFWAIEHRLDDALAELAEAG